MAERSAPDHLRSSLARAFVAHDPLEPWLTESHWDEHYWDDEAHRLAERLAPDLSLDDVRAAILAVLNETLPEFRVSFGQLRADRIETLTRTCWQLLQTSTGP